MGGDAPEDGMDTMGIGELVAFGGGLGVLHVLTGVDHVAAIMTISVSHGWSSFWLGARWGVGHSLGLLVMYGVFLSVGGADLVLSDDFASAGELVVGLLMSALGAMGIIRGVRRHRLRRSSRGGPEPPADPLELHAQEGSPHGGCGGSIGAGGDAG
ncbi:hypothetical protein T484DRAFT_1892356, partial [Baffinella frigidus]